MKVHLQFTKHTLLNVLIIGAGGIGAFLAANPTSADFSTITAVLGFIKLVIEQLENLPPEVPTIPTTPTPPAPPVI